jgi:hypothetical protein
MSFESEKVMFEIYRETAYNGRYKVVYFTELGDHNREHEINRALAGEHYYDGFLRNYRRAESKQVIKKILERLNNGEGLSVEQIDAQLAPFQPQPIRS